MPNYCYQCDVCSKKDESFAWTYESREIPVCCGKEMDRDYHAERFGGITNKEKGSDFATGFLETFENREAGQREQVFIKSRFHHEQELKKRGLAVKPPNPEIAYSRKHARDRVPEQLRKQREEREMRRS